MLIYNKNFEFVVENDEIFKFFYTFNFKTVTAELSKSNINDDPIIIDLPENVEPDQIVAHIPLDERSYLAVYIYDQSLRIQREALKENHRSSLFPKHIENLEEEITVIELSDSILGIKDINGRIVKVFSELLNPYKIEEIVPFETSLENKEIIYMPISYISCDRYNLIVYYDLYRRELKFKKVIIDIEQDLIDINFRFSGINNIQLYYGEDSSTFNFTNKKRGKIGRIFENSDLSLLPKETILSMFKVNGQKYFIHRKSDYLLLTRNRPFYVLGHGVRMHSFNTKNNIILAGRFTHYAKYANDKFNIIYLNNINHPIATVKRLFPKIPLLRRLVFIKIPKNKLKINDQIHNSLYVGNADFIVHNLKRKYNDKKVKTLSMNIDNEEVVILRTTLGGNLAITRIPYTPEYSKVNRLKITIAKLASKLFKTKKKTNLYFEKKSNKADESGFRIFEKVMREPAVNSYNYFILDSSHPDFPKLKEKYGKWLIAKYSFKHYLEIFRADYLISSELANHLLNDRLYIDSIRKRIMDIPLVFLQHGIMFAKPVDNPMAYGFHKDKNPYNIYKSVISSDLEAEQFYKMAYSPKDLLKTGLATFDYATLQQNANKIAYMPTYRYWEEGLIYKGQIHNTSYYKSIIEVIKAFESANLLDRLLIVPHNKFSEFIFENMPEYSTIISTNPSEALKESVIFITDYSSAIYDAIMRGAYPIFHWQEKEYLIDNYKAIPPVNEENAPGPISRNPQELVGLAKHAISVNYKLEPEYKEKYMKINEFNDRRNSDRIIDFLRSDNII
ncbi:MULTISPECIES: CDP-glycerol glycerophosphotransferase family protein [Bhargavaea]|uniref:CDP-glycerol glycerophosphotransferase family protein n=1 Tax=Bhargavaea changchunensis TaxID=2134037 RepID=A0ABW2NBY0_9BACL|nr:CDP-glycerol glycerophosphotransferase family protein [Bhargavaea sp. CC-171006]